MRAVFRYQVPVDDGVHKIPMTSDPLPVVANSENTRDGQWAVEFWAEHDDDADKTERLFRVFGTGHPLPDGAAYIGTAPRRSGLVLHLYEVQP